MKRFLIALSLMLIMALALMACAPAPTQPGGGAAAEEEPAAAEEANGEAAAAEEPEPTATAIVAEAGEGDIQLVYWNGLTGSDGQTMVEMVRAFTDNNPDVSVRVEMMPWDIYFDKLITSLVSGNPPDLFLLHEFEIPQFASQGVLLDTSDFYAEYGGPIPETDIVDYTMNSLEYEGNRYGVPLDIHGWGLWYNQDLFDEVGLESCPATHDEFLEYARKLTIDASGNTADSADFDPENIVQYGIALGWHKPTYLSTLWQFGGDWTDGQGNAMLDSEEAMAAAQFLKDLIYEEHVAPQPVGFNVNQSFAGDTLAMSFNGSWMLNFNQNNDINWGVCPLPQFGESPSTWTSSHVIYTPVGLEGEKLDAAIRLIDYLSDNGLVWATSGQPPARISQLEAMTMDDLPSANILGDSFMEFGRYDIAHECIQEVIDTGYMPELDAIFNDVKTVEEGLTDANDRIQDILDRCS